MGGILTELEDADFEVVDDNRAVVWERQTLQQGRVRVMKRVTKTEVSVQIIEGQ